jgi:hypothetical protein
MQTWHFNAEMINSRSALPRDFMSVAIARDLNLH